MAARKKSALKKPSKKKPSKKKPSKKKAAKKKAAPKKRVTGKKAAARRPAAKKKSAARRPAAKKKAPARRKSAVKKASGILQKIVDVFKPAAVTAQLTFITESLPQFTVGQPKKVSIEASGGKPPYTFALTQGTLPPDLQLNSLGTLFGTVQSAGGDTTIFVQVRDSARPPARLTQAFDLQIASA